MNNLPIQTYESVVQQRDALEKKLADMAAENAALNKFIKDDCWVWDDKNETYLDACDGIPETPATDSFLAEVRANGVEMLSEHLIELVHKWQSHGATSEDVSDYLESVKYALGFATQIRQGEKS